MRCKLICCWRECTARYLFKVHNATLFFLSLLRHINEANMQRVLQCLVQTLPLKTVIALGCITVSLECLESLVFTFKVGN